MLRPGRLTLFTRFPLGLYYAWAYLELDMHCIVYPRPAPPGLPLPPATTSAGEGSVRGQGHEDFAGLRQYHRGDSPRHIAWKVAARDQGLFTKQFAGRADTELWLDWRAPAATRWASRKSCRSSRAGCSTRTPRGLSFGLRLPGKTVAIGTGDVQRDACLEALALWEIGAMTDSSGRPSRLRHVLWLLAATRDGRGAARRAPAVVARSASW